MSVLRQGICVLLTLVFSICIHADVYVGVGKADMTPPVGTPSAGYAERKGEGMQGVHDPLLAIACCIDNGEKRLVLCSVDHLGFTYEMVQNITQQVRNTPGLADCEVYIASSHTHSGGGAYLDIPMIGAYLAGPYNLETTQFYEKQTVKAILEAVHNMVPAKIGIGYGKAENLSKYRGLWPVGIEPLAEMTIIKAIKLDGTPLAVLFNFPMHPTILKAKNRFFSADFVGYTRNAIQNLLGGDIQAIYLNGAQGDIVPVIAEEENGFHACDLFGKSLASAIQRIWESTEVSDICTISAFKKAYEFVPQPTPQGLKLPLAVYKSEMNVVVLNRRHAFITVPGELSCLYEMRLKEVGKKLGYQQVSILGLVNDAHGYMILPESWERQTLESQLSFGGKYYGEAIEKMAQELLEQSFQ